MAWTGSDRNVIELDEFNNEEAAQNRDGGADGHADHP